MAELGIIASVFQIADVGLRLSLRLYTFGETVASADKTIISISKDVSLTSNVLKELGQILERDRTSRICSLDGVQTAESIVKECLRIFQQMDQVLVENFANTKSAEKDRRAKAIQTLERLRWPFIKGKIELLTSNLERQKTTLVLLLNVIALAKQQYESTDQPMIIAEQRSLIQDLVKSNEGYIRRFEQLRVCCEDTPIDPEVVSASYINSMPMLKVPPARGSAGAPAVGAASQEDLITGAQGLGLEDNKRPADFGTSGVFSSDQLSRLLQQYNLLMSTLLAEVSAPKYEIAEDSRSRIKANIVSTHKHETRHLELDSVKMESFAEVQEDVCNKVMRKPVTIVRNKINQPASVQYKPLRRTFRPLREQKDLDTSHTPALREVWPSKNDSPSPSPIRHPQLPSRNDRYKKFATVTESTAILEQGAGDTNNLAGSPEASGTMSASKDNTVYSTEERNRVLPRNEVVNSRYENDLTEERAEKEVDDLLSRWTTLPVGPCR